MRIVIAPDKFKGSLSAGQAAEAIARGVRRALPDAQLDLCPIADGGEGTVDALVRATSGRTITRRVTGPLPQMRVVDATFGVLGDGRTAAIEMAAASGLWRLSPDQRHPLRTTTYGTGELILAAAEEGAARIILGIGGSATVDGGLGCVQACGGTIVFDDATARGPGDAPVTGGEVGRVARIDRPRSCAVEEILIACDVDNPLYGPHGAAPVYGPQKGASPEEVRFLDDALRQLARRTGNVSLAEAPGAGAAGGLGFGIVAFLCNARMMPGVRIVLDAVRLEERLAGADLCITGEGRLDRQSLSGKAPIGVARVCQTLGVRCIAFAGAVEPGVDYAAAGLHSVAAIAQPGVSPEDSMRNAAALLESAVVRGTTPAAS